MYICDYQLLVQLREVEARAFSCSCANRRGFFTCWVVTPATADVFPARSPMANEMAAHELHLAFAPYSAQCLLVKHVQPPDVSALSARVPGI